MKPTDEQIREFWEWCGVTPSYQDIRDYIPTFPPLDLNSLFQYAVPKFDTFVLCFTPAGLPNSGKFTVKADTARPGKIVIGGNYVLNYQLKYATDDDPAQAILSVWKQLKEEGLSNGQRA